MPSYTDWLDFIDLRARALHEMMIRNMTVARNPLSTHTWSIFRIVDYVACKGKHQLHKCRDFCTMSHDQEMTIVKKNALCMNCLRTGHFLKNCPTKQKCKVCQKPYHSLMHIAPPKHKEEKQSAKKPS